MSAARKVERILEVVKIYKEQASKGYASDKELVAAVTRILNPPEVATEKAGPKLAKGAMGGTCQREMCHNSPAVYYHHYREKWYCPRCAKNLNSINWKAKQRLGHDLLTLGETPLPPLRVESPSPPASFDDDYSNLPNPAP